MTIIRTGLTWNTLNAIELWAKEMAIKYMIYCKKWKRLITLLLLSELRLDYYLNKYQSDWMCSLYSRWSTCLSYYVHTHVFLFACPYIALPFSHIWELPVLYYHRIRVNYPNPFLGVIFRVILYGFIRQNHHLKKSNIYHLPLIMVNYRIFFL